MPTRKQSDPFKYEDGQVVNVISPLPNSCSKALKRWAGDQVQIVWRWRGLQGNKGYKVQSVVDASKFAEFLEEELEDAMRPE